MANPVETKARAERWRVPPQDAGGRPLELIPSVPPPPRSRPSDRRALRAAFAVSALIHVLVVVLYPLLGRRDGVPPMPSTATSSTPRPLGIEVIRMRVVEDAGVVAEAQPRPPPVRAQQPAAPPSPLAPPAAQPDVPPAGIGPLPPSRSAAEALRPGRPDLRLWTLDPKATELTREQLARMYLAWAILDLNDSTAAAVAAASRVADWTFTDEDGKRWGIANGKLHLGDFAVPLPFSFSPPPGSPAAQRAWVDAEIDRAAWGSAARQNLNERIRAIRERLELEQRRRLQSDTSRVPLRRP